MTDWQDTAKMEQGQFIHDNSDQINFPRQQSDSSRNFCVKHLGSKSGIYMYPLLT